MQPICLAIFVEIHKFH